MNGLIPEYKPKIMQMGEDLEHEINRTKNADRVDGLYNQCLNEHISDNYEKCFSLEQVLTGIEDSKVVDQIVVDAVERDLTDNPEYIWQAALLNEQKGNYSSAARNYSKLGWTEKALINYEKARKSHCLELLTNKEISNKDILKVVRGKTIEGLSLATKYTIKDLPKAVYKTISKILWSVVGAFSYPSALRRWHEGNNEEDLVPLFTIVSTSLDFSLSGMALATDNKYLLFFPTVHIATNIISGFYEWYRYEKKKIKNDTESQIKTLKNDLENQHSLEKSSGINSNFIDKEL